MLKQKFREIFMTTCGLLIMQEHSREIQFNYIDSFSEIKFASHDLIHLFGKLTIVAKFYTHLTYLPTSKVSVWKYFNDKSFHSYYTFSKLIKYH